MKNKAYIKPTKPALIAGIIAIIGMLAFGVFFMKLLIDDGSSVGIGFIIIWFLFVLLIGTMFVYNLVNKNAEKSVGEEISFTGDWSKNNTTIDFNTKLRALDALKKDKLISEEEFRNKRAEIMNSQW